jgi:ABC-2 type transport system permease protein
MTAFVVITGSISFWITRGEMISDNLNNIMLLVSTYPDTIFKESVRLLFYILIPVGFVVYLPMKIILHFNPIYFIIVIGITLFLVPLAFFIFNMGLKRYTSSNLMIARI